MPTFLHAADVHLDSPLVGLEAYEGAPVEAIRSATRRALGNLVELAIREQVDLILLAGDIYDGDWPDYSTGLFFVNQLRKLHEAGIPVVWLRGNHDAESRITRQLRLPPNAQELPTDQPGTVCFESLGIAVHGQGYARPAETRNIALHYPRPIPGYFNIGVLHTALNGREGHEPYAPCTVEQLLHHGYDYWALGHVHQRETPYASQRLRIEFPGNLQGRHIRESGPKGCLQVTVDAGRPLATEFRAVDVFRWAEISVQVPAEASLTEAVDMAAAAASEQRENAEGRPLAVRVHLACPTQAYRQVTGDLERFRSELAAQVGDQVWIERIKPRAAMQLQERAAAIRGDAFSEWQAALADLRSDPEALEALFREGECGRLYQALPPELRSVLDTARHQEIGELAATILTAASPLEPP